MEQNFERALALVLAEEGGFSNHPRDPGGATMRGVTQRTYDGYRQKKGLERQSVQNIEKHELRDIYKRFYWDKIWGDELPAGIDYCVFDAAVNSGPLQATKWLQRVAGVTPVDGSIGFGDIDDISKLPAPVLIEDFCEVRLNFMRKLATWPTFGKGWGARVARVQKNATAMSKHRLVPLASVASPTEEIEPKGRAAVADLKPTETAVGDAAVKGGSMGIGALVLTALNSASEYLALLTGLPPKLLQIVIVVLTVTFILGCIALLVLTMRDLIRRKLQGDVE